MQMSLLSQKKKSVKHKEKKNISYSWHSIVNYSIHYVYKTKYIEEFLPEGLSVGAATNL